MSDLEKFKAIQEELVALQPKIAENKALRQMKSDKLLAILAKHGVKSVEELAALRAALSEQAGRIAGEIGIYVKDVKEKLAQIDVVLSKT